MYTYASPPPSSLPRPLLCRRLAEAEEAFDDHWTSSLPRRAAVCPWPTHPHLVMSCCRLAEEAFDDQCTSANPRYPLIADLRQMYLVSWLVG